MLHCIHISASATATASPFVLIHTLMKLSYSPIGW